MRIADFEAAAAPANPVEGLFRGVAIPCTFAIGLMGFASPALAGAWTLDAGTGALIFIGTAMQSSSVFDSG